MSKQQIDSYLAAISEPERSTLESLRTAIMDRIPEAAQCITYQVPTFKIRGKAIAGFAAYKNHCSYFPMSGSVLKQLGNELASFKTSSGALQFPVDKPLSKTLVRKLIKIRLAEAFPK